MITLAFVWLIGYRKIVFLVERTFFVHISRKYSGISIYVFHFVENRWRCKCVAN